MGIHKTAENGVVDRNSELLTGTRRLHAPIVALTSSTH